MVGGDLHWIWKPYAIYQEIDYVRSLLFFSLLFIYLIPVKVYGVKALQDGDGFTNAQCKPMLSDRACNMNLHLNLALLNIVETFMNLTYLYLAHISSWPPAPVIGFAAASMTLSKTVLYWAQEYYCNGCSVGHNSAQDLLVYWIIPNGFVRFIYSDSRYVPTIFR